MREIEFKINLNLRSIRFPMASLGRRAAPPIFIAAIAFLGYYLSTYLADRQLVRWCGGGEVGLGPDCWYQHFVYLADAILHGTLDVASVGIPAGYQDLVADGASKYLPYQPAPALLLVPFVAIWGSDFSQVYFSMALGAVNVALFWYLLSLMNVSRTTKFLLVPFFAFGTAHFYAATTGTLWFYNHMAAVFFVLLAIIFMLRQVSPVIPALFLALAFLSRQSTILATPFFLYWMIGQRHQSILSREALFDRESLRQAALFVGTLVPFVLFSFWYNDVRFGGIFDTGLDEVYNGYTGGGIPYSFYRVQFPNEPHFNLLDIRNIPLHLYTIFLMPPEFHPDWSLLRPSPYGMSVLLTSPPFIFAAFVKRRDPLKLASWMAVGLVSIPLLLNYSQGWVQFGYRFLLDFAPFLLILTALGFDDHRSPGSRRIQVLLVAIAILAGFWGRYWANQLAW